MARMIWGNSLQMMVWPKQVSQIRGLQSSPNMCHMDGRVGSSGLRGLECPDVVVVDDGMEVEVRMNEGPSGVHNRVGLEASRRT